MRARSSFLMDSYQGTGGYEDGSYLDFHPREVKLDASGVVIQQLPKFKNRRLRAYYYNVIKTVVDVPISYIFQSQIVRTGDAKWLEFTKDCTGRGTPLNIMMEQIARYARIFGVMFFLVDKPEAPTTPQTLGDEKRQADAGIKPRIIPIFPSDVCDYFIEEGKLKWVKVLERHETSSGPLTGTTMGYRVRIWTEDEWFVYDVDTIEQSIPDPNSSIPESVLKIPAPTPHVDGSTEGFATEVRRGKHGLGRVPLVALYNQEPEFGEMFGTTDIFQSARVNRRIYNLCSELDEILRDQTFAILVIPTENTETAAQQTVGTANGIYYTPVQNQAPAYIQPSASSAKTISEAIVDLRGEIHRAASMQYTDSGVNVRSGVAKQWNFDQTNRFLASLAKRCETAEKAAGDLVLLWNGKTPNDTDVNVQYPGTFNISDLMEEIEQADAIMAMRISKTFATKVAEDLVRKRFPNLTSDEQKTIFDEIAKSDFINPPIVPDGNTSVLATGSTVKAKVRQMRGMKNQMAVPTVSSGAANRIPTPQAPALDAGA